MKIDTFRGDYYFLSNMYPCEMELEGRVYPALENLFQSFKCAVDKDKDIFTKLEPRQAKKIGRTVKLIEGWDSKKLLVMETLVRQKFSVEPFKTWLLETGNAHLEEGNWWGDDYWGTVRGKGENHLGKILMKVREELKEQRGELKLNYFDLLLERYNNDELVVLDLSLLEEPNLLRDIYNSKADRINLGLFCEMTNLRDRGFIVNTSEETIKNKILGDEDHAVNNCIGILKSEGLLDEDFELQGFLFTDYNLKRRLDNVDSLPLLYILYSKAHMDYDIWGEYVEHEFRPSAVALNMLNRYYKAKTIEDLVRYYAVSLDYIANVSVARSIRVETIMDMTIVNAKQRENIFKTLKSLYDQRIVECIKNPSKDLVMKLINESNDLILNLRNPEDLELRHRVYEKHGKFR